MESAAQRAGMSLDGPHPAFLVQGDDKLGALTDIHQVLYQANVNIYASSGVTDGRGTFGYLIYVRPEDFERAAAAGEGQDVEQLREGYQLIGQKMRGILEARGVQRMEAKGAEFDTDLHEAITQIPAPSEDLKGKVVDVVEPGYKLHDSVLRFAKVVVGN